MDPTLPRRARTAVRRAAGNARSGSARSRPPRPSRRLPRATPASAMSRSATRKPIVRDVSPISRGPETANRDPSGRSNMSADEPATSTSGRPSTSRTNAAISGRRSVAVPAKMRPSISTLHERSTFFSVEPTDLQLVASLRAGDEAAFRPGRARVERVDASRRADLRPVRGIAEDVVGETWLRVLERTRPLRGPLLAQDVGLSDPRQHSQDACATRGPRRAVLVAAGSGPRARGGCRRQTASGPRTTSAIPVTGRHRHASSRRSGCSPPRLERESPGDRRAAAESSAQ